MKRLFLSMVVILLCSSAMLAQLPTATILGTVKDSSGGIVPGADITARETQTNQTRTDKSGADGAYRFDALPVGVYEITVKAAGFQTAVQSRLTIQVGQSALSDFTLQVGSTSQTVTVSAEAVNLVDTTSSSLGSVVNQQQITDLPLNGRNYNDLTLLQAGVTKSINSSNLNYIGYNGTAYSSNGATQRSNMYLLDGAIQQSASGNNGSSALGTTLGVDGIEEYKVITNSFDAQYGMVMGSVMTIVSKSGTNAFHGDGFDFLRNSMLDARNYFDLPPAKLNGHRNPEFRRNQFGASLGGPIRKDKTFFFATYEGLRALLNTTNTTTTLGSLAFPTACHGPGGTVFQSTNSANPNYCPQLGAASATLLPQIAPYLTLYPAPNLPGNAGTVNGVSVPGIASNYGFVYAQRAHENYGQIRIDNTISDKDTVFGRWTYDESSLPYVGPFNQSHTTFFSTNQFLTLAETHVFSGSLVNSARFSFTREPLSFGLTFDDPRFLTPAFELVPPNGFGSISATGVGGIGITITSPRFQDENIFTGSDDINYNRGRHSMRFGAIFNHYQYRLIQHGQDHGSLAFGSLAAMMQGGPVSSFATNVPGADNVTRYDDVDTMGFYAQDSWKVFPRLTLNYGMRYEPTTTTKEIHGNAGTLRNWPADATFTTGSDVFTNPSLRNWSPRFGFAYDVFGNGKTAVRGGFNLLYDLSTWGVAMFNSAGFGPPLSESLTTTAYTQKFGTVQIPLVLPAPNTFQQTYRGVAYAIIGTKHEAQPHLISYNVSVQQQLPDRMALTLAYAGSHGINLLQSIEGNQVIPSGVPGIDPSGNRACLEQPAGTVLNNANQYDTPAATSCYGISTTNNPQCWPAGSPAILPHTGPVTFGNKTDCWSRLNSNDVSLFETQASGESYYNALSITLNKSTTHGLQFQAAYTYSRNNDNMQGVTSVDSNDIPEEPLYPHTAYGPSDFDLRNNFHFDALYHFPSVKTSHGFVNQIIDGWGINGIFTIQGGYPFSVVESVDHENINYRIGVAAAEEPDLIPGRNNGNITSGLSQGGCTGLAAGSQLGGSHPNSPSSPTTAPPVLWYDPCAFTIQPAGFVGTEPRGLLRGPGLTNVDMSIVKDTAVRKLGEAGKLEFRAEFFDLFNHPLFSLPNATVTTGSCAPATQPDAFAGCAMNTANGAGTINSTIGNSGGLPGGQRQIQVGLKLMF
jgi:hypothetical protein